MTAPDTLFTVGETYGRALRPENDLLAHCQDVGWRSLHAAIFGEAPLHVTESALDHPFIIYHIASLRGDAEARRRPPREGETITEWEHHRHPEILQSYPRRTLHEAAVSELYGCDASAAEIVPRFGIVDPFTTRRFIDAKPSRH